jgi:tetratricopeptide (TPR) repeat protein
LRRAARIAPLLVCALCAVAELALSAPASSVPPTAKQPSTHAAVKRPAKKAAAAAPAPADPSQAAWKRARALADGGRFDEALAVILPALERDPDNTDLLWLEAGVTGWSGRHREAVALYERLMTRHPELAHQLRKDLASERLWADDAAGAVRDFDLYLARNPDDREARRRRATALAHADRHPEAIAAFDQLRAETPDDVDLALERAKVLGWMGKHEQAVAAYREILTSHPGNTAVREGLARNENLRGNHREAIVLYEDLRRENNPEGAKGLAYAYYYLGQNERAKPMLNEYVERRPDDGEARELAKMIEREEASGFTTGYARSDDSDALRVLTTTIDYRRPLESRLALSLRWRRDRVKDEGGSRDPYRISAGLDKVWSERWAGNGFVSLMKPESDEPTVGLGEANLVYRPTGRVRIDGGYAKDVVLTRSSLERSIRVQTVVLGADWQAGERLLVHLDQRLNYYNDGNRSSLGSASAAARVWRKARSHAELGARFARLRSEQDLDNGYYDPERYVEFGPTLALELAPSQRWSVAAEGQIGYQRENDAENEPNQALNASLHLPLGSAFGLTVEGGFSDSNLSSSSGFTRKHWAAYLAMGL